MSSKKMASIPETVAAIHAHLSEAVPGYAAPAPAPAEALAALEEHAGALPSELLELYRVSDGIELPVEVPELASLLGAAAALEETQRAKEHTDNEVEVIVLGHQDFESDVVAVSTSGETRGQIVRWESVEAYFDEDYAEPFATFLKEYAKTLMDALPTPKSIAAAVARVAKIGRAGESLTDQFEKFSQPATILRAVLEREPDAPRWIATRYNDVALDRPLRMHVDDLPLELVISTAGKLAFAGTTTLLEGHASLADLLLAAAYIRDPEATLREAEKLEGSAKDGWLLMRRRMGLVPASAISPELRARLIASPRKYRVVTPIDGRLVQSPASGLEALEPYFESREELLEAARKAPAAAATTGDMVEIMLGDAPTAARITALFEAIGSSASYGDVPDEIWNRVPVNVLIEAAHKIEEPWCADYFGWVCVAHPRSTPEQLEVLVGQLQMPSDEALFERLSASAASTIKAKPPLE